MIVLGLSLIVAGAAVGAFAYVGYPAALWLFTRGRRARAPAQPASWPTLTITVPAYNEERTIAATLEGVLALDYPAERRHVLVVSDASTDRTDEIVRSFAGRGVELLRLPQRSGKTAAENAAIAHVRGDIVVQTDAAVRIDPGGLKPLIAEFTDPSVGAASGRDVSVAHEDGGANAGESGYVGYEMWVRDLETRAGGIVGASGCFYACRRPLHTERVPSALSRDFAAPLIAREHGYRTVSVTNAVCYVPRTASLQREYRRKVRTMTRGLETLFYKRHLMNPLRYGGFALMLLSHKLARWLVPWAAVMALAGLLLASVGGAAWGVAGLVLAALGAVAAGIGWRWPASRPLPRGLALPTYVIVGLVAGLHAWINALRGAAQPVWEPTRRS